MSKNAVVLLSGGVDSATTLALALRDGYACHALSVDYGQRHGAELDAAARISDTSQRVYCRGCGRSHALRCSQTLSRESPHPTQRRRGGRGREKSNPHHRALVFPL
jgi:adenylyl- and sulfurtransferase ThiI